MTKNKQTSSYQPGSRASKISRVSRLSNVSKLGGASRMSTVSKIGRNKKKGVYSNISKTSNVSRLSNVSKLGGASRMSTVSKIGRNKKKGVYSNISKTSNVSRISKIARTSKIVSRLAPKSKINADPSGSQKVPKLGKRGTGYLWGFVLVPEDYRQVIQIYLQMTQLILLSLMIVVLFRLWVSRLQKFRQVFNVEVNLYHSYMISFWLLGCAVLAFPLFFGLFSVQKIRSNEARILALYSSRIVRYELILLLYIFTVIPNMVIFISLTNRRTNFDQYFKAVLLDRYLSPNSPNETIVLNLLQTQFACCGADNYQSYFPVIARSQRRIYKVNLDENTRNYVTTWVPASCCNLYSNYSCFQMLPVEHYEMHMVTHNKFDKEFHETNIKRHGCDRRYISAYSNDVQTILGLVAIFHACYIIQFVLVRIYRLSLLTAMTMGHTHLVGCGWIYGPDLHKLPLNHLILLSTSNKLRLKIPLIRKISAQKFTPLQIVRMLRGLKLTINRFMIYASLRKRYVVFYFNRDKPEIIENKNYNSKLDEINRFEPESELESATFESEFY